MNPIKGISAAVSLSLGATAVGLGAHFLSSPSNSTVEGKLTGERNRFLNFDYEIDEVHSNENDKKMGIGSYSAWLAIVAKHAEEEDESKKFKGLDFEYNDSSLGDNSQNQQSIKALKKKCSELLASEGSKENLDLFKSYCIRPQHHG